MHQDRNLLEQAIFIHTKVVIILWGITYCVFPPTAIVHELGHTLINVSAAFAIAGSLLGIAGLAMSNSRMLMKRHQGNIIEFAGLLLAICGPLGFLITIGYLTVKFNATQGYSVTIFAYALCAFMFSRLITVRRQMRDSY